MISQTKAYARILHAGGGRDLPWIGNSTLPVWLPAGGYYILAYDTVTQLIYANRSGSRYGVPLCSAQHNAHWAVCWMARAAVRVAREQRGLA